MKSASSLLVCGCYRSGTSAFADAINSHPDVFCPNELGLFCAGLPDEMNGWLCQQRLKDHGGCYIERKLRPEQLEALRAVPCNTESLVSWLRDNTGYKVIGDKYPSYTAHLDETTRHADKIIFLYRDPREVIESQIRHWTTSELPEEERKLRIPYGRATVEDAISKPGSWLDYMQAWQVFKRHNRKPYLEIDYRVLCSCREQEAQKVAEFLDVDVQRMTNIFIEKIETRPVLWRDNLPGLDGMLPMNWLFMMHKWAIPSDQVLDFSQFQQRKQPPGQEDIFREVAG